MEGTEAFYEEIGARIKESSTYSQSAFIVCPFIKKEIIDYLLPSDEYAELTLITRADLEDFSRGVSDIDVWKKIWEKKGKIYILENLHAKYYRFDTHVFFGSGNLTAAGLSLSTHKNFELMAQASVDRNFEMMEENLLNQSKPVTYEMYIGLLDLVKEARETVFQSIDSSKLHRLSCKAESILSTFLYDWIPKSTNPKGWIYLAYKEGVFPSVAAEEDFKYLSIPKNLKSELDMRLWIAQRFKHSRAFCRIEGLFQTSANAKHPYLSFGVIKNKSGLFSYMGATKAEKNERVNALIDWIEYLYEDYFCPAPQEYTRLLGRRAKS